MNRTTPITPEELERSYFARTIVGKSVSDVWLEINSQREEGNRIAYHNFIEKVNKYLINRHKILGIPPPLDIRKDAWARVRPTIDNAIKSLTIGDVQSCNGTLYIKGTVQEIVETQFGYVPENIIKAFL